MGGVLVDEVHAVRAFRRDIRRLDLAHDAQRRKSPVGDQWLLGRLCGVGLQRQSGCLALRGRLVLRERYWPEGSRIRWRGPDGWRRVSSRKFLHGKVCGQGLPYRPLERREDTPLILDAHLRLGGMDVDIHLPIRNVDADYGDGESPLHEEAAIRLVQGERQAAILHPAAVDVDRHVVPVGARE